MFTEFKFRTLLPRSPLIHPPFPLLHPLPPLPPSPPLHQKFLTPPLVNFF